MSKPQAAKKPSSAWTLRFQARADCPNIARFSDKVEVSELQRRALMYTKDEELREEEEEEEGEGATNDPEFFAKRRRRQRRYYRRKQTMALEFESSASSQTPSTVHYEGKMVNLEINPEAELQKQKNAEVSGKDLFKYVLLQFVKHEGSDQAEIHVVPVGDMYAFHKTTQARDSLLAEIEDRDREDQERKQALLQKYRSIGKALERHEKLREEHLTSEKLSLSAGDSFSTAMLKVFSKKKEDSGRLAGDAELGDSNAGLAVVLDETGVDADEFKEHDFCGGDYSARFADDEEDQVAVEQDALTKVAEQEVTEMWRYDEMQESDNEEAEEEEEAAESKDSEVEGVLGSAASLGLAGVESGFVDVNMLKGALAARKRLQEQQKQKRALELHGASDDGEQAMKKVRFEMDHSADAASSALGASAVPGAMGEGVSAAGSAGGLPPSSSVASSSVLKSSMGTAAALAEGLSAVPAAAATGGDEYTLTEVSVRKYIEHRGGRVSVSELSKVTPPAPVSMYFAQ